MQEFKEGQRVKVEFEGVILDTYSYDGCVKLLDDGAKEDGWNHYVYLNSPAVKVTLADPKDWPPQVGDIWEAEGREYFIQESMSRGMVIRPDDTMHTALSVEGLKRLSPVLVRRRGQ
jgi:hypothetical protein